MYDNIIFIFVIIIAIILGILNLVSYKNKNANRNLYIKIKSVEWIVFILLISAIFSMNKLRYQGISVVNALVIYMIPLALINFRIFSKSHRKDILVRAVIFSILITLGTTLTVLCI